MKLMNDFCCDEVLSDQKEVTRIKSVVAVAKWYHSRRAVMTLKRFLTPGIRYFTVSYELHKSGEITGGLTTLVVITFSKSGSAYRVICKKGIWL